MITPYDWQEPLIQTVVGSLTKDRVFVSGYPTGAGKTVISLAAAKRLGGPHLVIAPKVAITKWWRTADAMGMRDQLVGVLNPERVNGPRGSEFYTRGQRWKLPPGTTVIWDEPHRGASGPKSVLTKALAELKAYARALHAMSATVADSPLKLRALGWWCGLHQFHDSSFYGWCQLNGCKRVEIGWGPMSAGRTALKFTVNAKLAQAHMAAIRRAMGTKFQSLRADDIPGFPTQTVAIKLIDLEDRQRSEVDAAYAAMSERMTTLARSQMAELGRERERIEFVVATALADLAAEYVAAGNSVVAFFSFTEPRLRFEAALRELEVPVVSVHGDQKETDRQAAIDAFQRNEVHAISVMTKAGGVALDLHDCLKQRPRVSLITPTYEADLVKQNLGRIRRCEGTHATQFIVLVAGTIQEKVVLSLERKLKNIDTLNDTDLLP
jgi:superfamily II DNA or RNA helicase